MQFFNPAAFLPSPEVAVNPAPRNDTLGFAVGEAVKAYTRMAQEKRNIDDLRGEANAYADYFQETGNPTLAGLLRNKAKNYSLGTDTDAERKNLLHGTLEMSRQQNEMKKAEMYAQSQSQDNFQDDRLRSAQRNYETLLKLKQDFDQAEELNHQKQESLRARMAGSGKRLAPYVKKPNPYNSKVEQAEGMYNNVFTSLPDSVVKSQKGSGTQLTESSSDVINPPLPDPNSGPGPLPSDDGMLFDLENSDTGGPRTHPETLIPAPAPAAVVEQPEPAPVAESPPVIPEAPTEEFIGPSQDRSPVPVDQIDADAIEADAAIRKQKETSKEVIRALAKSIELNIDSIPNKKAAQETLQFAKKSEKDIEELPGVGTQAWVDNAKNIIDAVKTQVASIQSMTIPQKQAADVAASKKRMKAVYTGDVNKEAGEIIINVYEDTATGTRYEAVNKDHSVQDVTAEVKAGQLKITGPAGTNVMAPGADIPSIVERMRKLGAAK